MILVTGGTGLVGSHLLYRLLKKGKIVRALHRKNSNLEAVWQIFQHYGETDRDIFERIEWFEAEINDVPTLIRAFDKITTVYHCAAWVNFNPDNYYGLKKTNIEGTANIVNISLAKEVKKLCFVSSVAALGNKPDNGLIDEETYWNPDARNNVYALSKYGAEMEVWRGTQEGLNAIIVNPGIILGPSPSSKGSGIAVQLGSRGIPFYPSGGVGIVDVKDVVYAMTQLMESTITNNRFILVGHNISYRDLLTEMAIRFAKKPPKWKLSKSIMMTVSGVDWFLSKTLRTKRKIVKDTVRAMFTTSQYDGSKIEKTIDFRYTSLSETLDTLATAEKQKQL